MTTDPLTTILLAALRKARHPADRRWAERLLRGEQWASGERSERILPAAGVAAGQK